jgi:hypothetical protein
MDEASLYSEMENYKNSKSFNELSKYSKVFKKVKTLSKLG